MVASPNLPGVDLAAPPELQDELWMNGLLIFRDLKTFLGGRSEGHICFFGWAQ